MHPYFKIYFVMVYAVRLKNGSVLLEMFTFDKLFHGILAGVTQPVTQTTSLHAQDAALNTQTGTEQNEVGKSPTLTGTELDLVGNSPTQTDTQQVEYGKLPTQTGTMQPHVGIAHTRNGIKQIVEKQDKEVQTG